MPPTEGPAGPALDPTEVAPVEPDPAALAVTRPAPGIACIRVPLPYPVVPTVNVYLLETARGPVLVDCGTSIGLGWSALEAGLTDLGVEPASIGLLVLTHTHSDHAGLAAEVVARTGCRVARGPGPHSVLDRFRDPTEALASRRLRAAAEGVPPHLVPLYVGPVMAGDGRHVRVAADLFLEDGSELPAGGWRALAAPGHSPNQVCLYRAADGTMISADLVLPVHPPFLEWGHGTDPAGRHRSSLLAARTLRPRRLLPGHGRAIEDPEPAFASALNAIEGLLGEAEAIVAERPVSAFELSLRLAGGESGLDRRQSLLATSVAALEHLERVGVAASTEGGDGVRRFRRRFGH